MQKVSPPTQTIEAFREVQAARIGAESAQNEAQAYANRVIPDSRGRSAQIIQAAEAYREQTVQEAKGQASRFLKVYDEYAKAPDVTRKRIYLETLERVLGRSDKIILDSGPGGNGVVPFFNLNEPSRRTNPPAAPATTGGPR
jgi:membrane protease subunit HflK